MPTFLKCTAAVAAAFAAGTVYAQSYLNAGGQPVRTGGGQCWRTGYWAVEAASSECDPQIALNLAAVPAAPKPVRYSAEVLFAFDDDVLTPDARKQLDALGQKLVAMEIEKVVAVGYADGVGPADYNKRLSARRAKAVGDYLGGKGVSGERLQLVAMGEHDATTVGACDGLETDSRLKLIACLQPDRRVKVELIGREKAELDQR